MHRQIYKAYLYNFKVNIVLYYYWEILNSITVQVEKLLKNIYAIYFYKGNNYLILKTNVNLENKIIIWSSFNFKE